MKHIETIIVTVIALLTLGLVVCNFYILLITPEHYEEIEIPTPNVSEGTNCVEGVVLHHTASTDYKRALDGLTDPSKSISCHVIIDYDGTRYVLAKPEQITWHAGRSYLNGKNNCNDFTIGIEFQGNTIEEPLTNRQIASAIEYLIPIIKKHNIPLNNIVTHEMIREEWLKRNPDTETPTKSDIVQHEYKRFIKELQRRLKVRVVYRSEKKGFPRFSFVFFGFNYRPLAVKFIASKEEEEEEDHPDIFAHNVG